MNLILQPRVSEKSVALAERGQYVFDVSKTATKLSVAAAVTERFKVEVEAVNVVVAKGKLKNFRRTVGRQRDVKKAIVTLKKGQTINLFEGAK